MDGTVLDANENYLNAMGYTLAEVTGKHHSFFVEESYKHSQEYRKFWSSLNCGQYQSAEFKRLGKNGKEVWIQASYNPILDANGRPCKIVKFATDVTQQKIIAADYAAQIAAIGKSNWVIEFGMDGTILTANDNFLAAMGYSLSEISGKHHEIFLEQGYKNSQEYREFWAKLNRGEYQSAVFKRYGRGRREVWIQASYNPILDLNGKPFKVVKYATDITQRIRTREKLEKLRTSETRYRELFENNPLPSWIYSLHDFRILAVNEAAIKHFGWSREEFLSLTVRDLRMEGQTEVIEEELRKYSSHHLPTSPFRYRRKSAGDIWVELRSNEIEEAGCPARLITAHDITDRLNAAQEIQAAYDRLENLVAQRTAELQTSEAKWRGLVEALPQFAWSTSPEGECNYISYQATEYTGVPVADLLENNWSNVLHPSDICETLARWSAALKTGREYKAEYRIRSKDGEYRWFIARAVPVRSSPDGPIIQWLGTCTDIDDQKRSEERLESAVAERTAALAEARDRAECAARAKSSFLAMMSHEIRTPMNGVIGMTGLLLETSLTSEQRCYADTIRSSGEALLSIINDVLDFSKVEAGKLELETIEFDLQTLLEECVELVAPAARAKGLRLALDVKDNVPLSAISDPGRLRQILLNLVSNGIKFTERGSVSVTVSRESFQTDVMTLRIAVRDTGIGIPPEQQARLFQAFAQADLTTMRRFGGTGLGLSIAKRLVELMGGSIGVSSKINEGSTFWFNICVKPGKVSFDGSSAGRCALILNESPETSRLVKRYLQRSGIQSLEAAWDPSNLQVLTEKTNRMNPPVSLLIVDTSSMRSAQEFRLLRSARYLGRCPAIVLGSPADWDSSDVTPALLDRAVFLAKPVRCLPLLEAVEAALKNPPTATRTEPAVQSTALQNAGILLVEDNKVNQLIAKLLLEKLGCRVHIAPNGREACARLEAGRYDLILMDCQMPEMDGFEATRRIREKQIGPCRTPIIALTAGVLKEERDKCYQAGMDDFLSKPINKDQLKATVQKWLSATPASGSITHQESLELSPSTNP